MVRLLRPLHPHHRAGEAGPLGAYPLPRVLSQASTPNNQTHCLQERAAFDAVQIEEAQQGAATLPARWLGRIWDWLLSPGETGEGQTEEGGEGGEEGGEEGGMQKQVAITVQVSLQPQP